MCGYVQLVDPSGKAAQRHPSSSSTIGQRALSRMTTITAEVERANCEVIVSDTSIFAQRESH